MITSLHKILLDIKMAKGDSSSEAVRQVAHLFEPMVEAAASRVPDFVTASHPKERDDD